MRSPPKDVPIGKFEILATYTYAHALVDGLKDDEAKQRGMVAAIMGAHARLGVSKGHGEEFESRKQAAEKKKKTTITAESFDKQVRDKLGEFLEDAFLPMLKKLVEAGLSYDEVKRLVKIPGTWGAKISGEQFREPASASTSPPDDEILARGAKEAISAIHAQVVLDATGAGFATQASSTDQARVAEIGHHAGKAQRPTHHG